MSDGEEEGDQAQGVAGGRAADARAAGGQAAGGQAADARAADARAGLATLTRIRLGGVRLTRTDFAPDGRRAVEIGLTLSAPSQTARLNLNVDAHSELMSAYPWGFTTPDQTTFNLPDQASFNGQQLVFTDTGTPPVASRASAWRASTSASGHWPRCISGSICSSNRVAPAVASAARCCHHIKIGEHRLAVNRHVERPVARRREI